MYHEYTSFLSDLRAVATIAEYRLTCISPESTWMESHSITQCWTVVQDIVFCPHEQWVRTYNCSTPFGHLTALHDRGTQTQLTIRPVQILSFFSIVFYQWATFQISCQTAYGQWWPSIICILYLSEILLILKMFPGPPAQLQLSPFVVSSKHLFTALCPWSKPCLQICIGMDQQCVVGEAQKGVASRILGQMYGTGPSTNVFHLDNGDPLLVTGTFLKRWTFHIFFSWQLQPLYFTFIVVRPTSRENPHLSHYCFQARYFHTHHLF